MRAELALIQRRDAEAASLAREGLAIDSGHDPLTLARFKRRLGLALIGLGSKKEGLRLCREAAAAANSEEVSAQLGFASNSCRRCWRVVIAQKRYKSSRTSNPGLRICRRPAGAHWPWRRASMPNTFLYRGKRWKIYANYGAMKRCARI